MAAGVDRLTGEANAHEHFRADEAFVGFLDDLRRRAVDEQPPPRLLILGDMLDLLYVTRRSGRGEESWRDTSEGAAQAKLERIAEGHAEVFRALARLLGSGCPITVVPGNHDIELIRPAVQQRFRELLRTASPDSSAAIYFRPWIVYERGLVYAEHGSQHHDLNAFAGLLSTSRPDLDRIALPLGSDLTLYLVDLAERMGHERGEAPATVGAVFSRLRARPGAVARAMPLHGRFAWQALTRPARVARVRRHEQRSGYGKLELGSQARELGLREDTLAAIQGLAAVSPFSLERRFVRDVVAAAVLRSLRRREPVPAPYLERAARRVHEALQEHAEQVPFYVFGHAHRAQETSLAPDARYFNSGTWSTLRPRIPGDHPARTRFPFVEISRREGQPPEASLRWWIGEESRVEQP